MGTVVVVYKKFFQLIFSPKPLPDWVCGLETPEKRSKNGPKKGTFPQGFPQFFATFPQVCLSFPQFGLGDFRKLGVFHPIVGRIFFLRIV